MKELEFENELISILDKYDDNWGDEPLDGDEVDVLAEHLRNMLNYINGNIMQDEYLKLEELGKDKTDIDNYRAVEICDCEDNDVNYGVIMLHNRHSVKEFQQAIYDVKNNHSDMSWSVEDILASDELDKFDWFELPTNANEYVEI